LKNNLFRIDDIEDRTDTRRGSKAAHVVFGEALTINAANYVYFIAMKECQKLGNHAALCCFLGNFTAFLLNWALTLKKMKCLIFTKDKV
jgi:geranylgeranyl pyrophosphate synthase